MMAAKKLRFFWQNYFDDATLTVSSADPEYPVENLQNRWATWDWRSTGTDSVGESIIAEFVNDEAIKGFVLENMNLRFGAAVILQGNTTNSWGGVPYVFSITITHEMETAKRVVVVLSTLSASYQYWRITLIDLGNPDGYLSASRIYLGPVFQPKYHYQPRPTQARSSDPEIAYSGGGQTTAVKRPRYWTYDLPISIVGTDGEAFADIDEECGIDTPLWICLDSTDVTTMVTSTIYVAFMEHIAFPAIVDGCLWESSLRLRQEL
jgi:hypothetical protein